MGSQGQGRLTHVNINEASFFARSKVLNSQPTHRCVILAISVSRVKCTVEFTS